MADDYIPPFTISNKMLDLVSDISEKIGKVTSHKGLEGRPHLRRINRIQSIHSSLKIEANSLSLSEVRDVINGHVVVGDQKEILEVKNAYEAYGEIPNVNPYSIENLKRIHGMLTKGTVHESGDFRRGAEGVFRGDTCIFIAPPAGMVPGLMNALFSWMADQSEKLHPLILSAVFHYEFVYIHPFADGNGRMARLWHTAILSKWRSLFEYIPLESQIERFQAEYYEAIGVCQNRGNSDAFIEFMLEMISKVLDETIAQLKSSEEEFSEYVRRLLGVMDYDIPYTSKALLEKLGLKSKETLRKNYIDPALGLNLIKMTVPEKPNSRNQRYVRL